MVDAGFKFKTALLSCGILHCFSACNRQDASQLNPTANKPITTDSHRESEPVITDPQTAIDAGEQREQAAAAEPSALDTTCVKPLKVDEVSATDGRAYDILSYELCPGEGTEHCRATADGLLQAWGNSGERGCVFGIPDLDSVECYDPAPVSDGCSTLSLPWETNSIGTTTRYCCHRGAIVDEDVEFSKCEGLPNGVRCISADVCLLDPRCSKEQCTSDERRDCEDGKFCNGNNRCDATLGCVSGTPPYDDHDPCTDDFCDEETQSITHTSDPLCDDACTDPVVVYYGRITSPPLGSDPLDVVNKQFEMTCQESNDYCALNSVGQVYVTDSDGRELGSVVSSDCSVHVERWQALRVGAPTDFTEITACCFEAEVLNEVLSSYL